MNRERFPGLSGGWARLDAPAGSQMVDDAIEAMAEWMRSGHGANEHGSFEAADRTTELVASTRAAVAALFGGDPRGVVFGPSMTALTMRFAATVAGSWQPGDEVPAAPNAVGTVPDLEGIVAAAHAAGARVYVDAVHAAPHFRHDFAQLGCDVLVSSAYKWFGPHVAMLVAPPELLEELRPDKLLPSPDEVPERFELGTLPFESLAGVRAAADYVCGLDWDDVREHEDRLLALALEGLG